MRRLGEIWRFWGLDKDFLNLRKTGDFAEEGAEKCKNLHHRMAQRDVLLTGADAFSAGGLFCVYLMYIH